MYFVPKLSEYNDICVLRFVLSTFCCDGNVLLTDEVDQSMHTMILDWIVFVKLLYAVLLLHDC